VISRSAFGAQVMSPFRACGPPAPRPWPA